MRQSLSMFYLLLSIQQILRTLLSLSSLLKQRFVIFSKHALNLMILELDLISFLNYHLNLIQHFHHILSFSPTLLFHLIQKVEFRPKYLLVLLSIYCQHAFTLALRYHCSIKVNFLIILLRRSKV
jgi:hypothetical protein